MFLEADRANLRNHADHADHANLRKSISWKKDRWDLHGLHGLHGLGVISPHHALEILQPVEASHIKTIVSQGGLM